MEVSEGGDLDDRVVADSAEMAELVGGAVLVACVEHGDACWAIAMALSRLAKGSFVGSHGWSANGLPEGRGTLGRARTAVRRRGCGGADLPSRGGASSSPGGSVAEFLDWTLDVEAVIG
ncbi:hypothetical protein KUTG_09957 [Kutzneria sp. 744]|nr:hypothetical protein KUTG_09957 [Kutzneria sp. 744]